MSLLFNSIETRSTGFARTIHLLLYSLSFFAFTLVQVLPYILWFEFERVVVSALLFALFVSLRPNWLSKHSCASGGRDGLTLLWDLAEGKKLYSLDAGAIIHTLCFSPNRYWFCSAMQESVKIWDMES
ncbi:hypothetical protein Sjap_005608 [Stephania japonica]|uniref:Uncharacterized protein n=1 Tax=Stephania japonica TaxID=461633 RepID=A0AAP0PLA6_9MAGN